MTLARVHGAVVDGVRGIPVLVEVDVAQGLPSVGMVGLAGTTVTEARWRARSAIGNAGIQWPAARITIGLSPADVPKAGTSLDLAIAVGVLRADRKVPAAADADVYVGELGLDGTVHQVSGALAAAVAAWEQGARDFVVSVGDAPLVALLPGARVRAVDTLRRLIAILRGEAEPIAIASIPRAPSAAAVTVDLSDVRGQGFARQGIEVAAAGGHHCALIGKPGVGKSLLAHRLGTILPDLLPAEAVEVTALQSLAAGWAGALMRRPVVQAPHHSASASALLGTVRGTSVVPGAITLAHRGVLVMDEAPEFSRPCLEGLRQPMESGEIAVSRVGRQAVLPARFQLVLTANPCPCGLSMEDGATCNCSPQTRRRYADRVSGPLLDRIDVRIPMTDPTRAELAATSAESSAQVRERVISARARSAARFAGCGWRLNAEIPVGQLRRNWPPDQAGIRLLESTERSFASARGLDRVVRMAWSLADLEGRARPGAEHVAQALGLRGHREGLAA